MPTAKILIVDDTKANLIALKVLLKNIKAGIISVESGAQALLESKKHDNIALILLDVEMPGMDGFEVCKRIQENENTRSTPIIFVTANQDEAHIEQGYLAGAVDYLQKPIQKTTLLSKVRVFLDLWMLRSGLEEEIAQRKHAESKIEYMAWHDPLTNLPNRRALYDQINDLIYRSKRNNFTSAIIFIDLDGFKAVNDKYGHEAGDKLLIHVSGNYLQIVRKTDTVARIGGDEFVVLICDINENTSLISKIETLIDASSKPILLGDHKVRISASMGIALYPDHGDDSASLLNHADQAMYQAKSDGKNTFRFFSEEINRRAHRLLELQDNLRKAITRDELTVFFQPIVETATSRPVSAEALTRWHSPILGNVGPDEFIPAAESAGLIPELGCWVLRQSIEAGVDWLKAYGIGLRIAVNASTIQFRSNLLFETIKQQIKSHHWDPSLLEIEITEGLLLDDSTQVTTYVREINNCGVRLSVDDFGTGFSALSYLKNYPVSTVKIDRSFIVDLPNDHENKVLVKAILAMAHGLGLEVIAEGVETEAQWSYLKSLNCDYVQGYYFGKPMPKEEFDAYLIDCGIAAVS